MFFTQLFPLMDGIDVTIKLTRVSGQIAVEVLPDVVCTIKPARVKGTPEELDAGFIDAVKIPLEMAAGMKVELDEFKKSIDAAAKEKKEELNEETAPKSNRPVSRTAAAKETKKNAGRQMFSPADIGQNKAMVLITRINRFFGYSWQAEPLKYSCKHTGNILITCVDTAKARIDINTGALKKAVSNDPYNNALYWLDIGNLQKTGQCILGTLQMVQQPRKTETSVKAVLPTVVKKFPQLKNIKETDQGPSCSLAEALEKQDLFINSTLAQFGCNLLWKLIREGMISYHGCYVNLESFSVNPIKIQ